MERIEFSLNDGTEVFATHLHQSETYAHLLEGIPNPEYNRELRSKCVEETKKLFFASKTFLIEPEERVIDRGRPEGENPIIMPAIQCIARFKCHVELAPDNFYSSLPVIWYQDHFALPICEKALGEILKIPWNIAAE